MSIGDLLSGSGGTLNQIAAMSQGGTAGGPGGPGGAMVAQNQNGQASQAAQSPGDLVQAYIKLYQQDRTADSIDRHMAGLASAFAAPGTQNSVYNSLAPPQRDPGAMIGNIVTLQQQQYAAAQRAAMNDPAVAQGLATQMGVPPATARAIIASGQYGDVEKSLAGLSGDPTIQAMNRDRIAWEKTHPGESDPDTLTNVEKYKADTAVTVQKGKDVQADQANFAVGKNAYDKMITDTQGLLSMPGLDDIVGPGNSAKTSKLAQETGATKLLADNTQNALAKYNQVMAQQYGAGVADFKGAGRITNQELSTDMPSQSTMGERGVTPDAFRKNAADYIAKLQLKRAQIFGQAGQLNSPDLSDYDYDKQVNSIYKPGGSQYVSGQAPRETKPAAVQSTADIMALPRGKAYVVPKGLPQEGETVYRGFE